MCDYSLESAKSRAAEKDEDLTVKEFPSRSKGFVSAGAPDCAVCCKSGVEMTLHLVNKGYTTLNLADNGNPALERRALEKLGGEIPVTFHTRDLGDNQWGGRVVGYKDGFILPNGWFLCLQELPVGTRATVTKPLPKEITDAVKGGFGSKDDIEIRVQQIVAPVLVD